MSLEIIRIPEIVEYGTGFTSRWKCAWLPIIWKMQSDLFPVNSVDAGLTITSVADNGQGLAEFTTSANHLLLRFDWINVTSSTVDDYEGIEQIVEVSAANKFTLNIAFTATATGTAKKYYNNYHAIIEVYGGLPSGHEFEALDPSSLTTSVKVFFDSNNIAIVDLSRIGQTLINNIFDNNIPSWPNVLNFWDQEEILLKESFDVSDGTDVTVEERYACIKDGGFVTGGDWSNEGTGASWTFGTDQANVSLDETGDNDSKELTQTIQGDTLARFSITVTSTFTHTSGTPTVRLRAVIGGTTITVQGSTTSQATLTNIVTGLTADALGVFSLEADITAGSGTDTVDIVIDNVEVCIGLANKVVNSKLDFRNGRGGNMFDYIVRDDSTIAKWMTGFIQPTLFENLYFSLSIIIDGLTFANSNLAIEQLDFNGDPVDDDILVAIDDQDLGVYQLRIDQLGINSLARCIDVTIVDTTSSIVGGDWIEILTGTIIDLETVLVTSINRIYIAGSGVSPVLRRSDDQGENFTDKSQPSTGSGGVNRLAMKGANEDTLYVAQTGGFGLSRDGLDSYDEDTNPAVGGPVVMDALNAVHALVIDDGGPSTLSGDSGATWTGLVRDPPITVNDCYILTSILFICLGDLGEIYRTADGGATDWVMDHNSSEQLKGIHMVSATIGYAVGSNGEILKTINGTTWNAQVSGTSETLYAVFFLDASSGWAVGDNGTVLETDDGGATWTAANIPTGLSTVNFKAIGGFNGSNDMAVAVGDGGKAIKLIAGVTAGNKLSETKRVCIDRECASQDIYLMWLNQVGGWDFWKFNAEKDYGTEFTDSQRTEKNIYDNWPKSYNSESLNEEARIKGFKTITVRSQHLTSAQADSIGGIKKSMNVIWVKEGLTLSDKVTVLVDKNSFQRFNETDKLHTITFTLRQTDDIATQSN